MAEPRPQGDQSFNALRETAYQGLTTPPQDGDVQNPGRFLINGFRRTSFAEAQSLILVSNKWALDALNLYRKMRQQGISEPWRLLENTTLTGTPFEAAKTDATLAHDAFGFTVDPAKLNALEPIYEVVKSVAANAIRSIQNSGVVLQEDRSKETERGMVGWRNTPDLSIETVDEVEFFLERPENLDLAIRIFDTTTTALGEPPARRIRHKYLGEIAKNAKATEVPEAERQREHRRLQGEYGNDIRPILIDALAAVEDLTDAQRERLAVNTGVVFIEPAPLTK